MNPNPRTRTVATLAIAVSALLGAHLSAPSASAWTATLCDEKTGETRAPGSFPNEKAYYHWKDDHHAKELGDGEKCKPKHDKPSKPPTPSPSGPPQPPQGPPVQPPAPPAPPPVSPPVAPPAVIVPPAAPPAWSPSGPPEDRGMEMVCEDLNGPRWISLDHRTVEIRRREVSAIGYLYSAAQGRILAEAKKGAKECPLPIPALPPAITYRPPVVPIVTLIDVPVSVVAPPEAVVEEAPAEPMPVVEEAAPPVLEQSETPPVVVVPVVPNPWANDSDLPGGRSGIGRG